MSHKTVRQMRWGEVGYVTSWTERGRLSAKVTEKPRGTSNEGIRRKPFGFAWLDEKKEAEERSLRIFKIVFASVYFGLLVGSFVTIAITKTITGDAADPPIGFGMFIAWAIMTIIAAGIAVGAPYP